MAKFVPQPELSLNDQMQIRREKLAALQAEGRDPFVQTKFDFNADSPLAARFCTGARCTTTTISMKKS